MFHVFYHGLRGEKGLLPQKGDFSESITVIKSLFGFGEEPPMRKYLPEQRLAYVGMAFIILMLIISGLVKTYKNIYAPDMSLTVVLWATWIHNIFFVLFFLAFLAHMAAIASAAELADGARHIHRQSASGLCPASSPALACRY